MPQAAAIPQTTAGDLARRYRQTRALSLALVAPLSEADATIQSMEDASPAKWHIGHTTWFFETFLLRDHLPGYRLHDDRWPFVFNSYYEAEGERIPRFARGMLSRPTVAQIVEWREAVDAAMEPLLAREDLVPLIELGIAHEQQHQELLLTDVKHALFQNPLGPEMWPLGDARTASSLLRVSGKKSASIPAHLEEAAKPQAENPSRRTGWHTHPGGIALIGHDGSGFAYDNEGPQHRVLLEPFALADRLVTNAEWQDFIDDGGYADPRHWLSDGWAWVQAEGVLAPLYWHEGDQFTHCGWQARDPDAPVTHISAYEAEAYASWSGNRLPTEFEWEAVAHNFDPSCGNQLDEASPPMPVGGGELFGDCWQFTRSAYLPYPRFKPAGGAVGEYNGKFMSGQVVLRGASCATVRGHSRASYRNFFYPHQRWQFTGLRLARDIA
ncbi:ergothioneine biosynthesis protein EgtB [Parerythrobacter lacustris]|uniref:Ergothioneine biosynthesis protein EgtB n=1 Tax=Parerythrobacter lacustris TaxID=2969984 RepID=A0ABT1XP55_9SPHN|nr:ergothioneine biosynthesis protein EgtB [Parerythrobacter lacustris]MCR2833367.1 ergothioneine biosynthesis protein EgtB [Parerythrobacter lacustris]